MLPVLGSRERRRPAKRYCQPNSWQARGNFRASANGSGRFSRRPVPLLLAPALFQMFFKLRTERLRQHNDAVLASFAVAHGELPPFQVEIVNAHLTNLLPPQAGPIQQTCH
jgi:hypothetical protein